nr:cupin domain-containing protein [uncultured Rhodoferax sp.]
MPYPAVHIFDQLSAPTEYYLPAEKLVSGNPKQSLWAQYTDPTQKFSTGIWQSEPGKWNIHYTEEEFCQQECGVSILTDQDGNRFTVRAGDSYVIPRGFVGTWEVVETTRKRYVIYEA